MEQPLGDRCVFALRGVWFADRLLPRRDPCHPTKCFPPPNVSHFKILQNHRGNVDKFLVYVKQPVENVVEVA
jgi:hypothetical protein